MLIPILPTTDCVNFCFVMKEKKIKHMLHILTQLLKNKGSDDSVYYFKHNLQQRRPKMLKSYTKTTSIANSAAMLSRTKINYKNQLLKCNGFFSEKLSSKYIPVQSY